MNTTHSLGGPVTTRTAGLGLGLLLTVAFCLGTDLAKWFHGWQGNRTSSANFMAVALGDTRRMFARHFTAKADAYFHSGLYPSVFDNLESYQTPHIAEDTGAVKGRNTGDEHGFLGTPRNWIDRFGRQFYPTTHTHLSVGSADGHEESGEVREILPWLTLSLELDPQEIQGYLVLAYWLRTMGKLDDAERILRDGLKENPGDPWLMFDLGRLKRESRHDVARARNLWETALAKLARHSPTNEDEQAELTFLQERVLGQLARLEEQDGRPEQALRYLEQLKPLSPVPEKVQEWMDQVKAGRK